MKKSNLVKMVLIVLFSVLMIFVATQVLAADDYDDLSNLLNGTGNNTATENTSSGNTSSGNNTVGGNNTSTSTNIPANNTPSTLTTGNLTTNNATNNTNTNLPNTGIADTMPVFIIVVILGISSVYAYKKMKDYQDID